jgi:hypothetical protein
MIFFFSFDLFLDFVPISHYFGYNKLVVYVNIKLSKDPVPAQVGGKDSQRPENWPLLYSRTEPSGVVAS